MTPPDTSHSKDIQMTSSITGDIHTPMRHDSAHKHVDGSAIYVDDIAIPDNSLVVLIAQSPHAHARIIAMDLSAVVTAPGIARVISAADIPGKNDCAPVYGDDPVFADTEVNYFGQAIFAVAAETMAAARAAIGLAKISYEELPAIITIEAAMEDAERH